MDNSVQADGRHRFSHIRNVLVDPHPDPLPVQGEGIFRESIFNALGQALFGDQAVDQLDGAARALGHFVVVRGDDHREIGLGLQFAKEAEYFATCF